MWPSADPSSYKASFSGTSLSAAAPPTATANGQITRTREVPRGAKETQTSIEFEHVSYQKRLTAKGLCCSDIHGQSWSNYVEARETEEKKGIG